MFSKSFIAFVFLFTLTSFVNVQAAPSPALDMRGNLVRNDVELSSNCSHSGQVNITQNIGTSTPVVADAKETPSPLITHSNRGTNDSQTAQIGASGAGKKLVAAKKLVNGDADPTSNSTQRHPVEPPAKTNVTDGVGKMEEDKMKPADKKKASTRATHERSDLGKDVGDVFNIASAGKLIASILGSAEKRDNLKEGSKRDWYSPRSPLSKEGRKFMGVVNDLTDLVKHKPIVFRR